MTAPANLEIYVSGCSTDQLLDWLQTTVGPLGAPTELGDTAMAFTTGWGVVVVISPGGPFMNVLFDPCPKAWTSDVECARAAARDLQCVVRCDPGASRPDVDPRSDYFLEIDGANERIVLWDD